MSATAQRSRAVAWGTWNAGAAGYHTVIQTFVFSVYLTYEVGRGLPGPVDAAAWLGYTSGAAGFAVALIAPAAGWRADATGRHKRAVGRWTALTIASMLGLFAVRPDWHWLALGLVLYGIGSVSAELASVSHNAMLARVSTHTDIGRVSALGWAMGYVGGTGLLLVSYVGLIADGGLLGAPSADGLGVRLTALVAAGWFAVLAVPFFLHVPGGDPAPASRAREGVVGSYRALGRDLRELYAVNRHALLFLVASALYRDGLATVSTFSAVLAVAVYGVEPADVLIYGVVANAVGAVGALVGGVVEDRVGSKPVIVGSLVGLLAVGVVLVLASGPTAFWVLGLTFTVFIGPTQSSSRTLLARLAPLDRQGELFGLYATTGRAASFLAPTLFGVFVMVTGTTRAGPIGVLIVLAVGLAALCPVRVNRSAPPDPGCSAPRPDPAAPGGPAAHR